MSELMKKQFTDLKTFSVDAVISEIVSKMPLLLQIMYTVSVKEYDTLNNSNLQQLMPRWAVVYGILMQANFHELSLIQTVITAILEDSLCDQKVSIY
jgi:hypothetical protein